MPSVTQDYTLAQLQNAAKDHFGHEASWGCKRSSKGWELNQVRVAPLVVQACEAS